MKRKHYIKDEMVRSHSSMSDYLRVCEKAFRLYGNGTIKNPSKRQSVKRINELDFLRIEMPATWPRKYEMCKIIEEKSNLLTGKLGSRIAYIVLKDLTKDKKVVIDADFITDMRTGAAGALGIKYVSNRTIKRASIVGTGRVARQLTVAMDSLIKPEEIVVTSRHRRSIKIFIQSMSSRIQARLQPANSVEECIKDTDAILTAVPTLTPILSLGLLEDNVPISVIGGDPRSRQIGPEVLESKKVIVDNLEQAHQSGEFLYAKKNERLEKINLLCGKAGKVIDIGDVACGRLSSKHPSAIVYFTGLAAQDLLASIMIYERIEG